MYKLSLINNFPFIDTTAFIYIMLQNIFQDF